MMSLSGVMDTALISSSFDGDWGIQQDQNDPVLVYVLMNITYKLGCSLIDTGWSRGCQATY